MLAINEECNREIMLYLRNNLKMKPNGTYFKIPVRYLVRDLTQFSAEEIFLSVSLLLQSALITKTNPENIVSPRATSINGITLNGLKYIETVENNDFWNKFKKHLTVDNILNLINTGLSVAQIIGTFI